MDRTSSQVFGGTAKPKLCIVPLLASEGLHVGGPSFLQILCQVASIYQSGRTSIRATAAGSRAAAQASEQQAADTAQYHFRAAMIREAIRDPVLRYGESVNWGRLPHLLGG